MCALALADATELVSQFVTDSQLASQPFNRSSSLALLPRQALFLPHCNVPFSQPLAGLNQLDDVHDLLVGHDWEADTGEDPRHSAVHLVGAGKLEGCGAVGAREDLLQHGAVHLSSRLEVIRDGGRQERGRKGGRGEGQQVQGDEE